MSSENPEQAARVILGLAKEEVAMGCWVRGMAVLDSRVFTPICCLCHDPAVGKYAVSDRENGLRSNGLSKEHGSRRGILRENEVISARMASRCFRPPVIGWRRRCRELDVLLRHHGISYSKS
jgi:hypothetical protein